MRKLINKIRRIYEYWPLVAFLAITLFIFRKVIFSNFICISVTGDGYHCFYSWSYYFVWAIKKGIFPLWNFMVLCGQPFGVDPPSNFNILNMLAVFFGPKTAWSARYILCVFFAGYFTYLYARLINISRFSSFVCGAVYMFTNTLIHSHIHSVSFFIPLIFICLEKAVRNKKNLWIAFASIFMTLYYFNGNPQFALYIFIFSCCYIIFRCYGNAGKADLSKISVYLIIYAALTFGFSAIPFFRMFEVAKDSQRAISIHPVSYFMTLPTHFITVIIPYFYESVFRPAELNFFFGRFWIEIVKKLPPVLGKPGLVPLPYVGVFPLILGILAFFKRKPRSLEKFFGWAAVVTVVFISTSFLWHMIIRYIPLLNQMHQLQRIFIIYEFSLPIIGAIGLDALLKAEDKFIWRDAIRKISKVFLFIIAIFAVIFFIAHFFICYNKGLFFKVGKDLINKYIIGNPAYIAPPQLYDIRLKQLYQLLYSWTNILGPSFSISAIIVTLCAFVLYLYRKGIIKQRLFRFAVTFLILGDLFIIVTPSLQFTPAKEVAPVISTAEFLKKQPGLFRIFRLQDLRDQLKPMDPGSFLRPNTNLFYGLSSIEGWKSLMNRRYIEFIKVLEKGTQRQLDGFTGEFYDFDSRLISLMNVKYIVTSYNRDLGENFKLVYEGPEYRVYEYAKVLPRAFMVYMARVIENEKEILTTLQNPGFELDKEVILEERVKRQLYKGKVDSFAKAKVQIIRYEPHSVNIKAYTSQDGYLFLGDCYDPGWKIYVDGKPDKLYRADYIFRAVELSEGSHDVEFVYRPFSVKIGLVFTFIAILFTVVIILKEQGKG